MASDPQPMSGIRSLDQEHVNRRQFLNSLGKWSAAIIAAVSSLTEWRNGEVGSIGPRSDPPSAGAGSHRQQMARHKGYRDSPHGDTNYLKYSDHGDHGDQATRSGGSQGTRVPGGLKKESE